MATVLFALSCLGLPELLTGGRLSTMPSTLSAANGATIAVPPLDVPAWLIAAGVVNWLLGLAIIILLWRPAASRYYEAVSLSRRRSAYPPYAAPGYAHLPQPGYAPPGSPQWQPYGQPPADPQDPQGAATPAPGLNLSTLRICLEFNAEVPLAQLASTTKPQSSG